MRCAMFDVIVLGLLGRLLGWLWLGESGYDVGTVLGVLLGLGARFLVFQASCALADVESSLVKSSLLSVALAVVCVGLSVWLYAFLSKNEPVRLTQYVPLWLLWVLLTALLAWAVPTAVYMVSLSVR